VIVAAVPTDDHRWAFHVINNDDVPIDSVVVESVHYTWGDNGNSEAVGTRSGPIAPGASVEIYREIDTEMRTGLVLVVTSAGQTDRVYAEVGRLYLPPRQRLEPSPLGSWQ
jgi:hypothetical protein